MSPQLIHRFLIVAATACALAGAIAGAGPTKTDSPSAESLDQQLLEGFDAKLFDEQVPAAEPDSPRELSAAGEDVGVSPGVAALNRVQQNMRTAESLIKSRISSPGTREAQQRVIDDLDALIAQLDKQCQGACRKPGTESATKSGKPSLSAIAGQSAAADSSDRLEPDAAKPVKLHDAQSLVNELWGHLPEAERERLLQGSQIDFLPKYERELEQYFRRLAEEETSDEDR